jgi:hypothetical protein
MREIHERAAWLADARLTRRRNLVLNRAIVQGSFTRPIYQWLQAHPEKTCGRWVEALTDAIDGTDAAGPRAVDERGRIEPATSRERAALRRSFDRERPV